MPDCDAGALWPYPRCVDAVAGPPLHVMLAISDVAAAADVLIRLVQLAATK